MVVEPGAFSDSAGSIFSESLAQVTVTGKTGFVDTKGRLVVQPRFVAAGDFHEGRALVLLEIPHDPEMGCAYIDKNGAYVVPPGLYWEGHDFSEGLAAVTVRENGETRRGYIDRSGSHGHRAELRRGR